MKIVRFILIPFVPLFALIVKLRNKLFDKEIFRAESVDAKVVSVGNINIGGSGKTPLVIFLINHYNIKVSKKPSMLKCIIKYNCINTLI